MCPWITLPYGLLASCFIVDWEALNFKEVAIYVGWVKTMKQQINCIQKSNMWNLLTSFQDSNQLQPKGCSKQGQSIWRFITILQCKHLNKTSWYLPYPPTNDQVANIRSKLLGRIKSLWIPKNVYSSSLPSIVSQQIWTTW
jgi:hypothetical protein